MKLFSHKISMISYLIYLNFNAKFSIYLLYIVTMNIREMFVQASGTTKNGIEGYHVNPKYQNVMNSSTSGKLKKYQTKRGSYLEDYQRQHKGIPGPGVYQTDDNWKKRPQSAKIKYPEKKTYIDDIIQKEKKEKRPGPTHYKLGKSIKQMDKQKKLLSTKKVKRQDRYTYLDNVQYQASTTPGVGQYNARIRSTTEIGKSRMKPEQWRKKHTQQSNKKPLKAPNMTTYDPQPTNYILFSSKYIKNGKKNLWGNQQRFKNDKGGSGLGPGKYLKIQKFKQQYPVARSNAKSVYYQ